MRTLLLADDSVTTQRVIALTFADDALRVVTVSDGQQAIESMAAMRPDIVLAGTTLPGRNGYELAEYMRGIDGLRGVPVLLLSGAFETVDTARLAASGASGLLEKPLEPRIVISRVKELLGLKDTTPAMPPGRLVTSADTAADKMLPVRPQASASAARRSVSSWDELRQESGLEPDAQSVESGTPPSGREDYLDTLDAAFDSLDQHLAGRRPETPSHRRNPSPPIGQASGAPDPRSPGRRPTPRADSAGPNHIFEVDTDWFSADQTPPDAAAANDKVADGNEAMPAQPDTAGEHQVFEVDDEWFTEGDKAQEARRTEQRELAAEMGIHEVTLPIVEPGPVSPSAAPVAASPLVPAAALAPRPAAPGSVADHFAELLALETGELVHHEAAPAPSVVVPAAVPAITDAMLDQIAARVADRLNSGAFGAQLRDTMASTLRETVRSVVADTTERLVGDEIARVKAKAERDTP